MSKRGAEDLDFKELMSTWQGRWLVAPLLVAVAAMFATALILGLLQVEAAPPLAYSLPAVPAVGVYLYIQLRPVLGPHKTRGEPSATWTKQSTRDGAIIQGHNNVVTVYKQTPAPSEPAPRGRKQEDQGPTFETEPATRILVDQEVVVGSDDHEAFEFHLEKGDRLEGTLLADRPLDAALLTENQYLAYWDSRVLPSMRRVLDDATSGRIRWRVPRRGSYRLVLHNQGTRVERSVRVSLRCLPTTPMATS